MNRLAAIAHAVAVRSGRLERDPAVGHTTINVPSEKKAKPKARDREKL